MGASIEFFGPLLPAGRPPSHTQSKGHARSCTFKVLLHGCRRRCRKCLVLFASAIPSLFGRHHHHLGVAQRAYSSLQQKVAATTATRHCWMKDLVLSFSSDLPSILDPCPPPRTSTSTVYATSTRSPHSRLTISTLRTSLVYNLLDWVLFIVLQPRDDLHRRYCCTK